MNFSLNAPLFHPLCLSLTLFPCIYFKYNIGFLTISLSFLLSRRLSIYLIMFAILSHHSGKKSAFLFKSTLRYILSFLLCHCSFFFAISFITYNLYFRSLSLYLSHSFSIALSLSLYLSLSLSLTDSFPHYHFANALFIYSIPNLFLHFFLFLIS
ncbi:unnamed protein product [Acanthosepion pharaonis]|uniref:Uncharacterized protein n=1 Tax=Acanthosepion pharaonis TaxID=158019 RepID=A0A812D5J7_ACAPH|nr:unnamed protein product [Sepia pharaonis]